MIPSHIEKEILIEAPIDTVWRVLTEPDQITQWFSKEADLDGRPGGGGRLRFESGETYHLFVERFEPPHRFVYRWLHEPGIAARPENSMLVEFTLRAEDGHTRLNVVESGFDRIDWSDDAKQRYADDHSRGWSRFAERLRDFAPRASL